jgi:polyisoprenoid-binding protein YceI
MKVRAFYFILALGLSNSPKILASIEFVAQGRPAIIKVQGKIPFEGTRLKEADNKISVDLSLLTTGIGLRDEHLKENYLEIKKYPTSTLEIITPLTEIKKTGKFKGKLNLHGVTEEVSGEALFTKEENSYKVDAHFEFKLSLFKIGVPSYQGITIADDVQVRANFMLMDDQ